MSVEKFLELGPKGYQVWRAEEVARRRLKRPVETVVVDHWHDPEILEIPRFMRPDPVSEFIEAERRPDETDEMAHGRLRLELEILLNRAKHGPLAEFDEARKRTLTSGLKGVS